MELHSLLAQMITLYWIAPQSAYWRRKSSEENPWSFN